MIFFREVYQEVAKNNHKLGDDSRIYNLRDYAVAKGVDLDQCIEIVRKIVEEDKYFVGSHMGCTRENVLKRYDHTGEVIQDTDHIKGLMELIATDLGYMKDR